MHPWLALIDPMSRLLDKIIPDPDMRAAAKLELLKAERGYDLEALRLALAADQSQSTVNQEEAGNTNLFVAGWRPFIGWICGIAFAYHFILQPLLVFLMASIGHSVPIPEFDMTTLSTVLMGMLGLGGFRTIEKIRGTAK